MNKTPMAAIVAWLEEAVGNGANGNDCWPALCAMVGEGRGPTADELALAEKPAMRAAEPPKPEPVAVAKPEPASPPQPPAAVAAKVEPAPGTERQPMGKPDPSVTHGELP